MNIFVTLDVCKGFVRVAKTFLLPRDQHQPLFSLPWSEEPSALETRTLSSFAATLKIEAEILPKCRQDSHCHTVPVLFKLDIVTFTVQMQF